MNRIVVEPSKIRQDVLTKVKNVSPRNAKLWLTQQMEGLNDPDGSRRFCAVLASLKMYLEFPSGKFGRDRNMLAKALKAVESLLLPTS